MCEPFENYNLDDMKKKIESVEAERAILYDRLTLFSRIAITLEFITTIIFTCNNFYMFLSSSYIIMAMGIFITALDWISHFILIRNISRLKGISNYLNKLYSDSKIITERLQRIEDFGKKNVAQLSLTTIIEIDKLNEELKQNFNDITLKKSMQVII